MCFVTTTTTIILIIVVISIAPYLTDKGEYTALYKVNNNVNIKTSKIMSYIVIILYSSHELFVQRSEFNSG